MTTDEHASTATMLLAESTALARQPRTALAAGELIWGATVHALNAIAHLVSGNSRHWRQGRDLEKLLTQVVNDDATLSDLLDGLHLAQRRLHNHFYTGQLTDANLAEMIDAGMTFVRRLLHFAERGYFDAAGAPAN